MAFIAGTPLFTNSGWKKIEDISGRDKVLVRNFLGDAEFIQPFALKKKKYDGKIIKIGAKDWSFSVTPDHRVIYDVAQDNHYGKGRHFNTLPAKDMKINPKHRIYRKFKYMFAEEPRKEIIKIRDEFGTRSVSISDQDWYKLVAYVLVRGFTRMKPGKPMLFLFLEDNRSGNRVEEETRILGDILDRIGLGWHVQYSEKTRPKIVVSSMNNLANKLVYQLGSKKRKEMFLPDKMIYNSTKELASLLIETILNVSNQSKTKRNQIITTNKALLDSLTLLGTLSGYSVYYSLFTTAGTPSHKGIAKKDSYILHINSPTSTYQPKYIKKSTYSGFVYEIDLFDGQVYVKERSMPTWTNPK